MSLCWFSTLRRFSEPVRYWLGLLRMPASNLNAHSSVESDQGRVESWVSSDKNPIMTWQRHLPFVGWHMLEVALEQSGDVKTIQFEVQCGKADLSCSYSMPLIQGRVSKRLIYFPWGINAIHLRFNGNPGAFQFAKLRVVYVPFYFAYDRLLRRLINFHPAYRDMSQALVLQRIRNQAKVHNKHWRDLAISQYESTLLHLCVRRDYAKWIEQVEIPCEYARKDIAGVQGEFAQTPQMSVMIWADAPVEAIKASLQSLFAQSFEFWQVVIVLPQGGSAQQVSELFGVADEQRVMFVEHDTADLSGGLLRAFRLIQSDYVMLLHTGDQLANDALLHLADTIATHPHAHMLYSDEDNIDQHGRRSQPRFKPGWNPDLLFSVPYIGGVAMYRYETLLAIAENATPKARSLVEFEYALCLYLYNFLQNAVEDTSSPLVVHVPRILLHRGGERVASSDELLPVVRDFAEKTSAHIKVVPGLMPGTLRMEWPLPEKRPLVSLLVPTRDGVDILKPCVDAILALTEYQDFELLILDNQSTCPKTLAYINDVSGRDSRVRVLRWNYPFNYSAINNFGASMANGSIIGLVNNDVEPIHAEWLTEMVRQVCRPEIGCVGAKLYYGNETIQHAGVILGVGGVAGHGHRFFPRNADGYMGRLKLVQNLSAVTAACLLLRKEVFNEVGGLNETDLAVAYNDVDLCLKVREAGYRNLWTPYAELYHHESVSRGADDTPAKRKRALQEFAYMRKAWAEHLERDPAYNPNLTFLHEDFSLR